MRLLQVSELLGSLPDLTQEEGAEPEKKSSDRVLHPEDELADLAVNTGETEVLSDIFGLDLRREGGQYKITPHDPNASLTHMIISPPPAAIPSPEFRQRHEVSRQLGWDVDSAVSNHSVLIPFILLRLAVFTTSPFSPF